MKIAVTGKGGVGKTTFAATLARLYADEGKKVLAADVDPDANLGLALGFDEETLDSIVPISRMRKLVEERTGANSQNQFYKLNPKVDDIPDTYGKTCNAFKSCTSQDASSLSSLPDSCDLSAADFLAKEFVAYFRYPSSCSTLKPEKNFSFCISVTRLTF